MNTLLKYLSIPILVGCAALILIFSQNGILNIQTDTQVYTDQIHYFDGEIQSNRNTQLRSFKPLYGIIGASMTPFLTPEEAILVINIAFYFGLIISAFFFLKLLGFDESYSALGASWVATGYPLLKYGLALLTDISGWFFAVLTLAVFLWGIKKESGRILVFSSFIAFVGSLCKETGVLGIFFGGLYLVGMYILTRKKVHLGRLALITVPFVVLQGIFLYTLFYMTQATGISFLDWFLLNKNSIGGVYHTWYYFFFVEASTFNILWLYVIYVVYSFFKKKIDMQKENILIGACLVLAVLPPLIWPVFLARVLYIGYLAIIPAALLGLTLWSKKNPDKRFMLKILIVLPIIFSVALFFAAKGGSLFFLINPSGY